VQRESEPQKACHQLHCGRKLWLFTIFLVSKLVTTASEWDSEADQILTYGNLLKLYIWLPKSIFLFLYFVLVPSLKVIFVTQDVFRMVKQLFWLRALEYSHLHLNSITVLHLYSLTLFCLLKWHFVVLPQ